MADEPDPPGQKDSPRDLASQVKPDRDDTLAYAVDVWKKVVDVQQHFNDIELRIRNFALTLFAAVVGAGGLALQNGTTVRLPAAAMVGGGGLLALLLSVWIMSLPKAVKPPDGETDGQKEQPEQRDKNGRTRKVYRKVILGIGTVVLFVMLGILRSNEWLPYYWNVTLGALIFGAGVVAWAAFFFMDKYWYHRLLLGAVYHGIDIETRYADRLVDLGLTKRIGAESPLSFAGRRVHSSDKMNIFYGALGGILLTLTAAALFVVPRALTPDATTLRFDGSPALEVRIVEPAGAQVGTEASVLPGDTTGNR